jgi:8-oxo-dGTP pyrophosphatase MutT (NUDIX family)
VPGSQGEASFLLTRRPGDLPRHAGQFALPGGRLEPGEDAQSAARRELAEELGVSLGEESVLGYLDDFTTHSGFVITPVVLWGPEARTLAPDPREVAIAYRVPLKELYHPLMPRLQAVPGLEAPLLSLPLLGTHIYSPTAAIVYQLREVALEGRSISVQHFAQPSFAWR